MRTYIFAIGGSGSRVLRSLTMLLAAGADGMGPKNTIVPIIIDYDRENGDTVRTMKLLEKYQLINETIYPLALPENPDDASRKETRFFGTHVQKIKDFIADEAIRRQTNQTTRFEVSLTDDDTNITFAEHIGFDRITEKNGVLPTRHLLELLYDNSGEDSPTTELYLNLEKGFKGCPNIGCVVTRKLIDSPEIRGFFDSVNTDDRVIIIGSIFGGTGASGIPMLVDLLHNNTKTKDISKGVIAITPYFTVRTDQKSAIDSNTFIAKTKAALDAYALEKSVNSKVSAIYYVGDSSPQEPFDNHEGKKEQKNEAHIVELVGAMMAISFIKQPAFDANKYWEFGLADGCIFRDERDFHYYDFIEGQGGTQGAREKYIYPLMRLAMFYQFYKTYWKGTTDGDKNDVWLNNTAGEKDGSKKLKDNIKFKEALKTFFEGEPAAEIDGFDKWIKELAARKRPFKFVNVGTSEWKDLFYDLKTTKPGMVYGTNPIVDNETMREKLTKVCREHTHKNGHEQYKIYPEYLFINFLDTVLVDLFNEIVDQTAKQKK